MVRRKASATSPIPPTSEVEILDQVSGQRSAVWNEAFEQRERKSRRVTARHVRLSFS
jgi:hypothetical protein